MSGKAEHELESEDPASPSAVGAAAAAADSAKSTSSDDDDEKNDTKIMMSMDQDTTTKMDVDDDDEGKAKEDGRSSSSGDDSPSAGGGEESESDSDESGSDDADQEGKQQSTTTKGNNNNNNDDDGLSDYERLRLERIKRNQARLQQLGLLDIFPPPSAQGGRGRPKKAKKKKDENASAPRSQPKRTAKTTGLTTGVGFDMRKMRISYDPTYYERKARSEELSNMRTGSTQMYSRRYRCGNCPGCTRETDCNTCVYCFDKQNNNTMKRRCLFRACLGRLIHGTASSGAGAAADAKGGEEGGTSGGTDGRDKTVAELISKNRIKRADGVPGSSSNPAGDYGDDADVAAAPVGAGNEAKIATGNDGDASNNAAATEAGDKKPTAAGDADDSADDVAADASNDNDEANEAAAAASDAGDNKPAAAADDNTTSTNDKPTLPETCHVCIDGGDLFCCDGCDRGYHSMCHTPKIREIPEGAWFCMECNPKQAGRAAGAAKVDLYAILPAGYSGIVGDSKEGKDDGSEEGKDDRKKGGDNEEGKQKEGAEEDERKTIKVTVLEPKARCSVCSETGDVDAILCRACDQYYHTACHDPPLLNKPRGRWRCSSCKEAKAQIPIELLATIPEDHSEDAGKTLKVTVVGPEANCSECSDRGGETIWCRACDTSFHLQCHDPPLEAKPRGRWRCGKCKKANTPAPKPKMKIKREAMLKNLKLFLGDHDDDCYICYNGGDLVCCDFCCKAFHMKCHIPPLPFLPEGIWKCCECSAVERKKKSRCGECKACTRPECGECVNCLDKPKFGGKSTIKKPCVKKVCPYPRFAPPASSTTVAGLITVCKMPNEAPPSSSSPSKSKGKSKKRGRESSGGSSSQGKKKRAKLEVAHKEEEQEESEDEFDGGPIVVKFKLNSLKSAYMDSESVKIRKIINGALRDPDNSKAQDKACEFLRKHITTPENVKKIILFGGVEMICKAMREHPDKTIVQAEACCTLAEIVWIESAVSTKLAHEGAIDLIVSCMDRLPNNAKVQQMGCGTFRALSYDDASIRHIHDANGLSAVLTSMKRNPTKLAIQKEGCYFLQNLLVHSNDTAGEISKSRVVPVIVDAMTDESADIDFQQSVCGLIANLALDKKAKTSMGKSGAILSIITTLKNTADLEVKQAACSALKHLGMESSDNQARISEAGGLDAVLGALLSFPDDPVLLIASFGVLKELSINDEDVAREIVRKGFVKIILTAMKENPDLAVMQVAAFGVIGYLPYAKRDKNAPKLAKAIVAAMKNHSGISYVQIEACDALLELAQVAAVRSILKEKETRKLLLRAKEEFEVCESDVEDIFIACKK